jgi:hypothetical protein
MPLQVWHPPVELLDEEQLIISRIRRAKLFIFLRLVRHQLFDEHFQIGLGKIYNDSPKGHPPVPPAHTKGKHILQSLVCTQSGWAL